MKKTTRITTIILLIAVSVQWLGVGERLVHGLWQWYKFNGFSNNGHTTINILLFQLTLALTLIMVVVGITTYRLSSEPYISKAASISTYMLAIGGLVLLGLVISPIGVLVSR